MLLPLFSSLPILLPLLSPCAFPLGKGNAVKNEHLYLIGSHAFIVVMILKNHKVLRQVFPVDTQDFPPGDSFKDQLGLESVSSFH